MRYISVDGHSDLVKDKKTGVVSYILFENNNILVDQNRKSK